VTGPQLNVSGGAGGTTATYADLRLLGHSGDDLAGTLASISLQCHTMLTDPDVLASALLDPGGAAAFEKELLGALDGGAGLTTLAAGFAERSAALRVAAASYQAADEASAKLLDGVRWTAGFTLPLTADNVQMLCLENEHDIVPHLDAADNPDQPNRTTVTFDSQQGTIGDNHGTRSAYLPAATSLDHSPTPRWPPTATAPVRS
jgi:hypothetical protein